MLKFITNFFGKKSEAPVAPAPYKVETPTIQDAPVEGTVTKEAVQKAAKKPAVKKATARKPKTPKA
jgi:hypothetical protein